MHVVQQEDPLLRRRRAAASTAFGSRPAPCRPSREPLAVLLRLQRPHHPGAHVGEALVVEVHGVLRGEHHAHALGARLLQQGEQRPLGRRVGRVRREVAEDLVHVDEGAQLASCRPGAASRSSPCRGGARSRRAAPRPTRCAVETIERRGRPSGARSIRSTSSGSPSRQASNDGEASRLLRAIIRPCALLAREDGLEGQRADLVEGRVGDRADRGSRGSRPLPARQACSIRLERKTTGGDCSGSASIRTRPRRPATIDWISSRRSSSAESKGTEGASSDCSTFRGTPGARAGREDDRVVRLLQRRDVLRAEAPLGEALLPRGRGGGGRRLHVLARRAARPRGRSRARTTRRRASSKSSSRFARSPFGSIAITGTPCRSSSSMRTMARPVLPEPVMPTMRPWVSRSAGSSSSRSPSAPSPDRPAFRDRARRLIARLRAPAAARRAAPAQYSRGASGRRGVLARGRRRLAPASPSPLSRRHFPAAAAAARPLLLLRWTTGSCGGRRERA